MHKLSVRDLEVKGRRVLVRVDFNVPTEEVDGKIRITDDTRMRESLPTIELLRAKGAKVILLAHFGRPKGKPNLKYSLKPVADHLAQMIPPPVDFSPEVIGQRSYNGVALISKEPAKDVKRGLAGDESDEYMAESSNHNIYAVNTIANYDPSIIPLLGSPEGSAFERTAGSSRLVPVEDWDPPGEE